MHDLLPGARQYGRAIVGSTHWGNHLVQRAVEDLSGDPDLGPSPSQAGLLHGVSRLWNGYVCSCSNGFLVYLQHTFPMRFQLSLIRFYS